VTLKHAWPNLKREETSNERSENGTVDICTYPSIEISACELQWFFCTENPSTYMGSPSHDSDSYLHRLLRKNNAFTQIVYLDPY
jgi:hypothetical protein